MRIIGFAGYSGSGKTYCSLYAKRWCELHGYCPVNVSFANVLVGKTQSRKQLHEQRYDELAVSLQNMRDEEKVYYSKLCEFGLESEFKETVVLIDDISFLDDIKFIKSHNGSTCFIDASTRLGTVRDIQENRLAKCVTTGKYPLAMFQRMVDNNGNPKMIKKSLDLIIPNLLCE